jgi:hypothetical protein
MAMLARMYARAGKAKESQAILEELRRLAERQYVDPFFVIVHEARGETQEALDWLEKSYEVRSYWTTTIGINPHLDGLRAHPRYKELQSALKYPNTRLS